MKGQRMTASVNPKQVLFVCLGNICRSPTAEGVVRDMAARGGIAIATDSAGTSDWHLGDPPYEPMQQAALARGYDLSDLSARRVSADDFWAFDLIIAMDADNLANLEGLRPAGNTTPVELFLNYAETPLSDVPDPYFTRDFSQTLDLVEEAAKGLLATL